MAKKTDNTELGKVVSEIKGRMGDHVAQTGMSGIAKTYIETGIFGVDMGLLGGIPENRVSLVYGHPAAGKSTVAMAALAASQRKHPDMSVVYLDAEGTFDPVWGQAWGLDMDRLVYVQPESGEQCVDVIDGVLRAKETSALVLDSIPAIVPQRMIDRSAEDPTMAARAALVGVACSKILSALQFRRGHTPKVQPAIILINQWRSKVGFVLGNPHTLPGGNQPNYLADVKLEMKKKKEIMGKDHHGNEIALYNEHAFDIDKSKGGSSIRQGEYRIVTSNDYNMQNADKDAPDIHLPIGTVDDYKMVATYAKRMGFITGGGGSWYIDGIDTKFGKLEIILRYLVENKDAFIDLKRKMIALKRQENGLSPLPPDGYLLGRAGKANRPRSRSR